MTQSNKITFFSSIKNWVFKKIFKDDPLVSLKFSLCLFFSLLPFRILGLARVDFILRLFFGLAFLILVFRKAHIVIPAFLNSKLFQLFFFYSLRLDDALKSINSPAIRVGLVGIFIVTVILLFFFRVISFFVILSLLFTFSFYKASKFHFANLRSDLCFVTFRKEWFSRFFIDWKDFIENLSNVTVKFFNCTVTDKLDIELTRNIFFRFFNRNLLNNKIHK